MRTPTLYCDDGTERELPFKWKICGTCRGEGKSSAYLGAFTASEMDEEGPEFMEDYVSGFYDRCCDVCGGDGKVKVPDYSRMTKKDRREFRDQRRAIAEVDAEEAAERRMGA